MKACSGLTKRRLVQAHSYRYAKYAGAYTLPQQFKIYSKLKATELNTRSYLKFIYNCCKV